MAVPSVATALVNPAACIAMTSIYPSQRIIVSAQLCRAKFRAKRFLVFLNTGVSEEFLYFGWESSITRPPKAITRPDTSMIGNITRLRNAS